MSALLDVMTTMKWMPKYVHSHRIDVDQQTRVVGLKDMLMLGCLRSVDGVCKPCRCQGCCKSPA